MKVVLLLTLLTVCECDSMRVKGHTGQDVTLPCKYDRKYYGALSACWQQGEIPTRGCSNQLISTDGDKVLTSTTSRYRLLGRLEDGDVSLTIKNLTEGDAGQYGCRVEIPGWFNDDKHHFDLSVITAPQIPTWTTPNSETPAEPTAASEGHMTSAESLLTSNSTMTSSSEGEEGSQLMVVVICVLLGLVSLLTIAGLLLARRLKLLDTVPQQHRQVGGSVQFNSTSSTLQLHAQPAAVDNIYQMDGGEGDVYENCP